MAVAAINKGGQGPYSSPTSEDLNLGITRGIEKIKSDRERKTDRVLEKGNDKEIWREKRRGT